MDKQFFIFNGPPACGKDTASNYLAYKYSGDVKQEKFAQPLKDGGKSLFGLTPEEFSFFEDHVNKSVSNDRFFGKSWRQVQIDLSESFIKPMYGKDAFPKMLLGRLKTVDENFIVISDGGFDIELECLVGKVGIDNVHLVHIFRDGCDFSKDSRNYMSKNLVKNYHTIYNNGSLDEFLKEVDNIFLSVYNKVLEVSL